MEHLNQVDGARVTGLVGKTCGFARKSLASLSWLTLLATGLAGADCNSPSGLALTKPDSIYQDNMDGTVTDTETGLTWAKCALGRYWIDNVAGDSSDDECNASPNTISWQAALEAAQTANADSFLGYDDWRLPNVNELVSLVESACTNPQINVNLFPDTVAGEYWTSSHCASSSNAGAWKVFFNFDSVGCTDKVQSNYVRFVRGGL